MIDALATNHTSFLREPDHFDFLRQQCSRCWPPRPSVEIWSAACSTGEEVWTLACLHERSPAVARRSALLATDISNKALRFAERAVYPAERCQGFPAGWLSRYFVLGDRVSPCRYRVCPRIRAQATFRRINLVEAVILAAPVSGHLLPQRDDLFRPGDAGAGGRPTCGLPGAGRVSVCGPRGSLTRISHSLEYVRPAMYRKPGKREGKWTRSS